MSTGLESLNLTYSYGSWGDVDMNGTPDLFIMGVDESRDIILNKLYLNNGDRLERRTLPQYFLICLTVQAHGVIMIMMEIWT